MKCCIIYEVTKGETKDFLEVVGIELCEKTKENSIKVLSGDFSSENLQLVSSSYGDAEYICDILDFKILEEKFGTCNFDKIRNIIIEGEEVALFELDHKTKEITESNETKRLYENITKSVRGQDSKIKEIVSSIMYNQKLYSSEFDDDIFSKLKKSLIITGETGTGKTEIINKIKSLIDVPVLYKSMSDYSASGVYEEQVQEILLDLVKEAGYDLEKAERGIIVFDNIEALATFNYAVVPGILIESMQDSLLSILEGKNLDITITLGDGTENTETFESFGLTLIFMGDLEKYKNSIKFNNTGFGADDKNYIEVCFKQEFLNKITNIIELNDLAEKDLKDIIINSDISPLKLKKDFYESIGVTINQDNIFVNALAKEAYKLNKGARGISDVLDRITKKAEYSILSENNSNIKLHTNVKVRKKD